MSVVPLMWLSVRAVLVGTSLVLAGHLGFPGVAGTEPVSFSLPVSSLTLCDGEAARPLEPEAVAACVAPVDPASAPSSVKQPVGGDSSSAPSGSAASITLEVSVTTVNPSLESVPTALLPVPLDQKV